MADFDPSVTSEERIQWLRERGVQIELSSKETKRSKEEVGVEEKAPQENDMVTLVIVMIPWNDKEPCEELHLRINRKGAGDQLLTSLKGIFASNEEVDTSLLQDNVSKQFGNMDLHVSEKTVSKVAKEGNVEVFSLARPHPSNNFLGVNIYLDEAGQLKKLPDNKRASAIAGLCGYKNVPFVGDVFIGRLKLLNNSMLNVDFRLPEISSDAAWLKDVEKQNYDFGVATNQVAMDSDLKEETSGGEDLEKGYRWTEDESSVEIIVEKPSEITYSKDISVVFHSRSVRVASKSNPWKLDFALANSVSADDSTWTLNGSSIEISLEKSKAGLWRKLCV